MLAPSPEELELGTRNWDRLRLSEQGEVVRKLAHRLAADGYRLLGANVVGLAFGARKKRVYARNKSGTRSSKTRLLLECPTLIVLVDKKRPELQLTRQQLRATPRTIVTEIELRSGRKRLLAIPTDVISAPRTPQAQALDGVEMVNHLNRRLRGSVAAIVRDVPDSGERYLLSCHHVACLSLLDPDLKASVPAEALSLPEGSLIGDADREAFFGAGLGPCIDAALIRLDAEAYPETTLLSPLFGAVRSYTDIESERPAGIFLYSMHKPDGVSVLLQRGYVNLDVRYESGAVATIVEVLAYRLEGLTTRGGDSGGMLVSGNGIFVGMHIAGTGMIGYAIPAYMLLGSPAFDPPIVLDL